MSDLISRQAVYDMLHGLGGCDAEDEWSKGWDKAIDSAIKELDKIPTAYDERYNSYIKSADVYRQVTLIMKGDVKDESNTMPR